MELLQQDQADQSHRPPSHASRANAPHKLGPTPEHEAPPHAPAWDSSGWEGPQQTPPDLGTALYQLKRRHGLTDGLEHNAGAPPGAAAVLPLQTRLNLSAIQRRVQARMASTDVQAKGAPEGAETDAASASVPADGPVQQKAAPLSPGPAIQARAEAAPSAPVTERASGGGSGTPLHEGVRNKLEGAFGADLSSVRVHQDASADAMGALAYTQGEDVHFGNGQYDPESSAGQELIGHELTHVLQQRAGRVSIPQGKGLPINDDPALETEADVLGAQAARGIEVTVPGMGRSVAPPTPAFQLKPSGNAPIQRARKPLDAQQMGIVKAMLLQEAGGEHATLVAFFNGIQDDNLKNQAIEEMWQAKCIDDTWYKSGLVPTVDDWEDFGNIARKFAHKDKQNRPAPQAPSVSGMKPEELGKATDGKKGATDATRERSDRTEDVLAAGSEKTSTGDKLKDGAELGHEILSGANDGLDAGTNASEALGHIGEATKEGITGVTAYTGGALGMVGGLKDVYGGGKDALDGSLKTADRVEGVGTLLSGSNDVVQGALNIAGTAQEWAAPAMDTLGGVGSIISGGFQMALGTYSLIKNWVRTDALGKQAEKVHLKLVEVGGQIEAEELDIKSKATSLTTEEAELKKKGDAHQAATALHQAEIAKLKKEHHTLSNAQIKERQDAIDQQKVALDKQSDDVAQLRQTYQVKLDGLRTQVTAVQQKIGELEKLKNAEEATLMAQSKTGFERNTSAQNIVKGAALVAGGVLLLTLGASNPIGWIVLAGAAVLGGVLLLVNWWRKSREKQNLTDRLLETDKKLEAYNSGKAKNQQMSKDKMRQQLLETNGFASVNSFYKEYIQLNAAYLNNILTQIDQNPALANETEGEAALGTVSNLGLKVDFTTHQIPTVEDIADKLGI